MTYLLGENSRNPAKEQEMENTMEHVKTELNFNNNKHMLVLYKRWKKYNESQLAKNKST